MSLIQRVEKLEEAVASRRPPPEERDLSALSIDELRRLREIVARIDNDGMENVSDKELMEAERLYLHCPLTRKDGYQ